MSTLPGSDVHNRLAFEAYAQIASKLSACNTHDDVGKLLKQHLKYLLNFKQIRITYCQHKTNIIHLISTTTSAVEIGDDSDLTPFEKVLFEEKKPMLKKNDSKEGGSTELKGWYFNNAHEGALLFSISRNPDDNFSENQSVVKLLAENLMAKFLQFNLYDQLDKQNDEISRNLAELTARNSEIQALVASQKTEIERQTENIKYKNEQLRKIAKLNAHEVREPLTRILALTKLLKMNQALASYEELSFIEEASSELDKALQHTIRKAEIELKY